MYNHAPSDYKCPICLGLEGQENGDTLIRQSDFVYRDNIVSAFISSFFIGNNSGHVIIVPNYHFENIFDLSGQSAAQIHRVARAVAIAMKHAYNAQGISTLQNNEPAGNQHAFHYHLHVFPRYENDDLFKHMLQKKATTPEERLPYADKIKLSLKSV